MRTLLRASSHISQELNFHTCAAILYSSIKGSCNIHTHPSNRNFNNRYCCTVFPVSKYLHDVGSVFITDMVADYTQIYCHGAQLRTDTTSHFISPYLKLRVRTLWSVNLPNHRPHNLCSNSGGAQDLSLLQNAQSGLGDHPGSYSVGTRGPFLRGKQSQISHLCEVEL